MGKELVHTRFEAKIETSDHIYDGDSINHCFFRLPGILVDDNAQLGEIYPELFAHKDGLWVKVNVRLDGIDAPEMHPHHHYPDGTNRDPAEIAHEHELALRARQVVVDLIEANDLQFEIRNPQLGKYAGRVVAEVFAKDPEHGELINVSHRLVVKGLAYPYEGGTKRVWKLEV